YAAQLSYLNCAEEALLMLDEAYRGDPDYPPTRMARGQILTYLGRMGEAAAEFEACIERAPQIGQAHWFLSHIGKAGTDRNHVKRLRHQLALTRDPREIASFAFALHKELDDLDEFDDAWQALEQA